MAKTIERDWINEKRLGVEGAALVETYLEMDVSKVGGHAEQLQSILLGKPLQNDEAVFRVVREYVVAKLVYFMKLLEGEFDVLQADELDSLTLTYWQRLAGNNVETAMELVEFCRHQTEEMEHEGQGGSQAAEAWHRAKMALERYVEAEGERLLASAEKDIE